jgi:thiol-disulfide isomerase/thioredoxin
LQRNEGSVDGELALLPLAGRTTAWGSVRNPMYTTTNLSVIHPTNGVFAVTRIDAPTSKMAKALIDKSLAADQSNKAGMELQDEALKDLVRFFADADQMNEAIDALLADQQVPVATTRSYGCSTKWSYKRDAVAKDDADWKQREVTLDVLDAAKAKALASNGTSNWRVINFWATTCGPCVAEMPDMVETARRFQNRPMELITISTDPIAARDRAHAILKAKHVATPKTREEGLKASQRISNNYIVADGELDAIADAVDASWSGSLPHTVLISPEGKVVWKHNGEVDPVELRRVLVETLADH